MSKPMNRPAGTDNFEFELVENFLGYNSSADPTKLPAGWMVRGSTNVYKTTSGTIANRPGRKLYDAAIDATLAGIKSAFVWDTSLGVVFPLRVANSKLQVESNVTGTRAWYDLMTSLSKTRFVFDTYWDNTDKKDKLLMVIGDSNIYDWSGGIALFVSATSNVITLDRSAATAGFASSGSVVINGNTYTYSGTSGSTLTGTTDASAETANSVVIAAVITQSNKPASGFNNDFIRVIENQAYIGSYTSQLVYISKNTDYTDHAQSTPRLPGEGNILTLDEPTKGIGIRKAQPHIFAGTSSLYTVAFTQITVGSTLTEQVNVSKIALGALVAAQAHEFIDSLADSLIYLDQNNQLRSFGDFPNLFSAKAILLSQYVLDELAQETFTLGQLKVVNERRGDTVYITAPNSGKVYIYQERSTLDSAGSVIAERVWQPPQIWSLSRIDVISGNVVGFSSSNPQIYTLWDTAQWHDDSPSGQLNYQSIMLLAYQNGGRRQGKVKFDKIYWEGLATRGSSLYGGVYYDYQGSTTMLSPIISDSTSRFTDLQIFTGVVPPSLGDASFGDNPLGDGLNIYPDDHSSLPKFRVITDMQPIDCFEYALMFYSVNADDRWELLALGTNAGLSNSQGIEVRK